MRKNLPWTHKNTLAIQPSGYKHVFQLTNNRVRAKKIMKQFRNTNTRKRTRVRHAKIASVAMRLQEMSNGNKQANASQMDFYGPFSDTIHTQTEQSVCERAKSSNIPKCNSYTKLSILSARTWKICVHIVQSFQVHKITRRRRKKLGKKKNIRAIQNIRKSVSVCFNVDSKFLTKYPMGAKIIWPLPMKSSVK